MTDTFPDSTPEARPAPPDSIHTFAEGELAIRPRGPWTFLRESAAGGFRASGLQLLAAWIFFEVASSAAWAAHLRGLTRMGGGWSALPQHWGDLLSAKDLWNLAVNGEMGDKPFGALAPAFAFAGLAWMLWASWKHQSEAAGVPARLRDWFLGFLDALLIGLFPLLVPFLLFSKLLSGMASTGIQGLGWLAFAGKPILYFAFVAAFMVQWWLCRLNRAGGRASFAAHLKHSFLRLWSHPIQWTALQVGGTALRTGLTFGALFLGWRWGGGTTGRVWAFLLVQVLATAANALLLGWILRLTARFWKHDREVRRVRAALESARAASILSTDIPEEAL